jgi:hypothetical protein
VPDLGSAPQFVTKQVGPLPVYAWVLVGVGGFLVVRLLTGRSAAPTVTDAFNPDDAATGGSGGSGAIPSGVVTVPGGAGTITSKLRQLADGRYEYCPGGFGPDSPRMWCRILPVDWSPGDPLPMLTANSLSDVHVGTGIRSPAPVGVSVSHALDAPTALVPFTAVRRTSGVAAPTITPSTVTDPTRRRVAINTLPSLPRLSIR